VYNHSSLVPCEYVGNPNLCVLQPVSQLCKFRETWESVYFKGVETCVYLQTIRETPVYISAIFAIIMSLYYPHSPASSIPQAPARRFAQRRRELAAVADNLQCKSQLAGAHFQAGRFKETEVIRGRLGLFLL
jgi:hypothetical protein